MIQSSSGGSLVGMWATASPTSSRDAALLRRSPAALARDLAAIGGAVAAELAQICLGRRRAQGRRRNANDPA
ncbi:hypothetical protein [Rhodobaculum claviforme]|uniref:hypothetical protein n=1 Tax=Rhodobaculum claviforme TaxID=1549854 RepID=UPI0019129FA4|nr:hypothetical protein [Rhodobaculum claviforme]